MSILQAVGLTLFPNLGGFAGSLMTRNGIKNWYEVIDQITPHSSIDTINSHVLLLIFLEKKLDKPSWRPPNWIFGPVILEKYALFGI